MAVQYDGVIEAVRYKRNGQIDLVRAYERHGMAFSDCVLLDRKTLLERLKGGKKFVIGQRKEFWANSFAIGKLVNVVSRDNQEFLTTCADMPQHDNLETTPAF